MKRDATRTGSLEPASVNHENEAPPLYRKLKKDLYDQIDAGFFKPGQLIPSERALCLEHDISRTTVRRCISKLIYEGLLYRRHGKGTFVAPRKIRQGLARIVDFNRTVLDLGMKPSTTILAAELTTAETNIAKELGLSGAAPVLKLLLLGKGDEESLVLYESYFPPDIGQKILIEARRREKEGVPFSTYDLYGASSGIFPLTVNQTFEAVVADGRMSGIMDIKKGSPLLRIQSVFLNADQRPLEFRLALYRGDRYKFHIMRDFAA